MPVFVVFQSPRSVEQRVPLNNATPGSCACPPAQWYRFRPFLNNTSLVSGMDRRTAARVVPTAEPTASTWSSDSAVVFTPVVPIEHGADDRQSGAASSARYREDGQEYASHLQASHAFDCEQRDATFCVQDRRGSRGQLFAWNRVAGSANRASVQRRVLMHRRVSHAACLVTRSSHWLSKRPPRNGQSSVLPPPH